MFKTNLREHLKSLATTLELPPPFSTTPFETVY